MSPHWPMHDWNSFIITLILGYLLTSTNKLNWLKKKKQTPSFKIFSLKWNEGKSTWVLGTGEIPRKGNRGAKAGKDKHFVFYHPPQGGSCQLYTLLSKLLSLKHQETLPYNLRESRSPSFNETWRWGEYRFLITIVYKVGDSSYLERVSTTCGLDSYKPRAH